ncbi:MAG: hypothetical protein ABL907_11425 [Hyphomicrobium sp.]
MTYTRSALLSAALAALAFSITPAGSAEDHKSDGHHHDGKHGGKVVESGHHHVEIVAKDGSLEVYVNGEDGKAEDISSAKATAAVLSDGKKVDITLAADPENFLKGTGTFKASKGATIVVTLTMPGHTPEQSRIKLD